MPKKVTKNSMAIFNTLLRAKGVASQTVLTMMARTNDTQLKRQTLNQLPDLLRLIREEEKHLPLLDGRITVRDPTN